jgi:hypothetical protein
VTIAISIKINDGLVLATDSASTLLGQTPQGQLQVINVYNNANKLFNLRKGFPIGAIIWGAGSIGQASISTIVKDLRQRFSGDDPDHEDWKLDEHSYTVEGVAKKFKEFVFDDLYEREFKNLPHQKPSLGFIIAGYSSNSPMPDEYQIDIQNGVCIGPRLLRKQDEVGATWAGELEALNRLILGYSFQLPALMQAQLGIQPAQMNQAMTNILPQIQLPAVMAAMPLQDAIDLAEFMVDLTIKFSRFRLGAPTVGGPVEIAAISKHEGFRWVKRKYYFDRQFNPEQMFKRVYVPDERKKTNEGKHDE